MMVSDANHLTPLTPMHLETRSRHTLSYPTCFKNVPACKLAPWTYQQDLVILDSWYGRSETLRGAYFHQDTINTEQAKNDAKSLGLGVCMINGECNTSTGSLSNAERELRNKPHGFRYAELYQKGAEYDLSVVDGKHNRTGRRQARTPVIPISRESGPDVGSNPTHPIPSWFHIPRWEQDAGKTCFETIPPTPTRPASILFIE